MIKSEVISEISSRTGVTQIVVKDVVENFFEVIRDNLAKGKIVEFRGYGSFIPKHRAQKTAYDITRGKSVIIPARIVPLFKPSKDFFGVLNKK